MSVTIYPEEPCLLPVTYKEGNPLAVYQKDYADIEDVLMCFKRNISDPEDKYLIKYYKDGSGGGNPSGDVLIDEINHTFTLVKEETDSVPVYNKGYDMYIGVKVTGLSKMLWLRIESGNKIIVEPDGIMT